MALAGAVPRVLHVDSIHPGVDLAKVLAREALATVRAGLAPVSRLRPLPAPCARSGLPPVVLVHGYLATADALRPLARRLLREGFPAADRVGYPSTTFHLEAIVERIDEAVRRHDGPVALVGHSLGAVASRAYVKAYGGADRVRRLVLVGGPHLGTSFWRLVPPQLRPVLDPLGPWVERLNEGPEPVPTVVIRARYDHQVFPAERGRITGTQEVVVHGVGHNGMLWSRAAHDALVRALTEPPHTG